MKIRRVKKMNVNLTIKDLLYGEIVWNKEEVVIDYDGKESDRKRLEFHYEAIDKNYKVNSIEPKYDRHDDEPFLLISCE